MKLYVYDAQGNKKYLNLLVHTRQSLAKQLGSAHFQLEGNIYHVKQVNAEKSENTALSMVLGGALGLVGGVPGVVIGGIIGGLLGNDSDKKDELMAEEFNRS